MKKYENIISKYPISRKKQLNSRKKGPQYCIISFYSKDIPTFYELVIKNTPVKN